MILFVMPKLYAERCFYDACIICWMMLFVMPAWHDILNDVVYDTRMMLFVWEIMFAWHVKYAFYDARNIILNDTVYYGRMLCWTMLFVMPKLCAERCCLWCPNYVLNDAVCDAQIICWTMLFVMPKLCAERCCLWCPNYMLNDAVCDAQIIC